MAFASVTNWGHISKMSNTNICIQLYLLSIFIGEYLSENILAVTSEDTIEMANIYHESHHN